MIRHLSALLMAAALLEGACLAQTPSYEPISYDYAGESVDAEIGRIIVPVRHADPAGPGLELAFMRLKSTAAKPGTPIVYLAGGPGGSGINIAKGPRGRLFLELRKVADVIALDQRGIGLSSPKMGCGEHLVLRTPSTRRELLAAAKAGSARCAAKLRAERIDLGSFNVVESAHDVDDLRRALGVSEISLWGSSYGTQLGFAVLRHHGDAVERVVFSGVEGPDDTLKLPGVVERQLGQLDVAIRKQPALSRRYPEPQAVVAARVLASTRDPMAVRLPGSPETFRLGPFDVQVAITGLMGTRDGMATLPATLSALDRRDGASPLVRSLAENALSLRELVASPIPFLIDCQSYASEQRLRAVRRATRSALVPDPDFPVPEACEAWGIDPLPASERAPVQSDVPILFLSGTIDGRTPASNVDAMIGGFPNATHVLIEGAGHGNDLFVSTPEIAADTVAFFASGAVPYRHISLPPLPIQ